MRKSLDQPAAELFEGLSVVSEVVVFEVDHSIALTIAQLDLFEHICQRAAAIIRPKSTVDGAKRAFVRTAARGDHKRHRLTAKSIRFRRKIAQIRRRQIVNRKIFSDWIEDE